MMNVRNNKRAGTARALALLLVAAMMTGCGSKETDVLQIGSTGSMTETLPESGGTVEQTEEDTEEETKKEKSEPTHETDVDETEEETDEDDTDHTGNTTDNSKSADNKTGKSTQEQEAETAASTKETTKAASQISQNQTTAGSTSGNSGNSSQTKPSGNTGSNGNTQKPTRQETTKAPVTLSSIKATYTGGTKTEGASVSGAEISVTATYSDGSSKAVNGWSCDKANQSLPAGSHTFTVTYEGKSSSFTVKVDAAPAPTQPTTQAPTTAAPTQPAQPEQPATSQAYIDEFMRGFNQARIDAGLPGNIGVNAKWSRYAQYYAEYHAKKWHDNWEADAEHSGLELGWFCLEGIGYASTAYDAGYAQTVHVGANQYADYGDIGVGVYYYNGRYYVCVQTWEGAEKGEVPFPNI